MFWADIVINVLKMVSRFVFLSLFFQDHMSVMYSASIDKLRSVLVAMQTTSSKRADLEQRLRGQLELRVQQLQQSTEEREKNDAAGDGERVSQLEIAVTALKADVVKVLYTNNKPAG